MLAVKFWFSSCDPFGVVGMKMDSSGIRMSSSGISQHLHLCAVELKLGSMQMSSSSQAGKFDKYFFAAVILYGLQCTAT